MRDPGELMEQTNNAFIIDVRREYGGQPIHAGHCKPSGMERILAAVIDPATRLLNVICEGAKQ